MTTPYISTPVTLITGSDAKGNEFAYAKSSFVPDGWIDLYNACNTTKRYIANYIIPSVVKVRFGNVEMTRQEWESNGCPFELSREQMQAAELETERRKALQIVLDVASTPKPHWMIEAIALERDAQDWQDQISELRNGG